MRFLVDTDLLIDALANQRTTVRVLHERAESGLAISIITVGELYEGACSSNDPSSRLANFRQFLRDYDMMPLTDAIMETLARERAALRRQGMLIPDMDLLIAATAITLGLTLMTRNAVISSASLT